METVFKTSKKLNVIYDLKGSTYGRSGKSIKKDLDLIGNNKRIRIRERDRFMEQLQRDAHVL